MPRRVAVALAAGALFAATPVHAAAPTEGAAGPTAGEPAFARFRIAR